jgi:hypothetical protein
MNTKGSRNTSAVIPLPLPKAPFAHHPRSESRQASQP